MLSKTAANENRFERLICLGLALVVLLLYLPAARFEFNNYDDAQYILLNRHVTAGLSVENFLWAFRSGYAGNWHPLTWLTHQADCQFFGLNAGEPHLVNALLHAVNALLLFRLLRMFGWRRLTAVFMAALFALHPLRVESVAWVAERKDVLSGLFFFLTLTAYVRYVREGGRINASRRWRHYAWSLVLFALGLMCKPMLVSVPVILLLLDYGVLNRVAAHDGGRWKKLAVEKIPFALLSAASCAATFWAQRGANAVQSLAELPLRERLYNAAVSYVLYLAKFIWPHPLSVIYPYSHDISPVLAGASALLLILVTAIAVSRTRHSRLPLTGWLWFLVTLLPVIGIVQVGEQSMADRYTYIPSVGLGMMIVGLLPGDFLENRMAARIASAVLCACVLLTGSQLQYWRNSVTLFSHALEVTRDNASAQCNLALALNSQGKTDEAVAHLREGLAVNPNHAESLNALAMIGASRGKWDEAKGLLLRAVRLRPGDDSIHYDLGTVLLHGGQWEEATARFREALRINPDNDKAHANLGIALAQAGKLHEAVAEYRKALGLMPQNVYARNALAHALEQLGTMDEAVREYAITADMARAQGLPQMEAEIQAHLQTLKPGKD